MALIELSGLTEFLNPPNLITYKKDILGSRRNFDHNLHLALPPFDNARDSKKLFKTIDDHGTPMDIHYDHGTTTLGFKYEGGVVLAVDSRAVKVISKKTFIGSHAVKKIVEINEFLLATLAGGAADCAYWDRILTKQCRLFELRNKERISVAAASKLMSNMVYNYKGMGICIGMMLAGVDKRGPQLFYMDDKGTRTMGNVFAVGSGSIYAYGLLDGGYRWNLTNEEAYELGRRAVCRATYRDPYSGGNICVYHLNENGWVNVSNTDCSELHCEYDAANIKGG